jgi:hypothetical protein
LLIVTGLICVQYLEIRWRRRISTIKTNTLALCERGSLFWYSDRTAYWTTWESCSIRGRVKRLFSSSKRPCRIWGLLTRLFSVFWGLVCKGRDVHSPSPSAEVRNEWSYISTTFVPHGVYLHRAFCTKTIILLVILRSLKARSLAVEESLSKSASRMAKRILGPAKEQITD